MSEQLPTIGRVVHFQYGPDPAPAFVTRVHSAECVNLTVFPDNAPPFTVTSALRGDGEAQWEWPPRPAPAPHPNASEQPHMEIGDALHAMRNGHRIRRAGWNGKGMSLRIVPLDAPLHGPGCRREYVEMQDAQGMLVPWLASQTDLLAADWEIAE